VDKTVTLNNAKIKKERQIVKAEETIKNGLKTDYGHCYFVMNDKEFNRDLDKLLKTECTPNQIIEVYWYHFFPYLMAQLEDNYKMHKKVQFYVEESQTVVNGFGELKFKADHMEDFIKAKGLNKEFTEIFRREENILEEKTKKLVEERANAEADSQLKLL